MANGHFCSIPRLKKERYDLDANDALWSAFIDLDFPTMAEGLDAEVVTFCTV